jgi:hypothetical protein
MKPVFDPKDFIPFNSDKFTANDIADIANAKLQKLINEAPVVTGFCDDDKDYRYSTYDSPSDTHKARLMFIEPIKKECVKHEPPKSYESTQRIFCVHCGVELFATWSPK